MPTTRQPLLGLGHLEMRRPALDLDLVGAAPRPDHLDRGSDRAVDEHAPIGHHGVAVTRLPQRRIIEFQEGEHARVVQAPERLLQSGDVHRGAPVFVDELGPLRGLPRPGDPARQVVLEEPVGHLGAGGRDRIIRHFGRSLSERKDSAAGHSRSKREDRGTRAVEAGDDARAPARVGLHELHGARNGIFERQQPACRLETEGRVRVARADTPWTGR